LPLGLFHLTRKSKGIGAAGWLLSGERGLTEENSPPPRPTAYEPAAKAAAAARQVVEACGRHPFATGLFALLGIFGLLFSFYTYGIDRRESAESGAQLETIEMEVGEVRRDLARQDDDLRDAALVSPLLFEVREVADNVTFQIDEEAVTALELSSEQAAEWMDRIAAEERHFSSTPDLWFTLRSSADKHHAQLAPYLLIEVEEVRRLAPDPLASIYDGGRGGEGEVRHFDAVLLPEARLQFAPLTDGEGATRELTTYPCPQEKWRRSFSVSASSSAMSTASASGFSGGLPGGRGWIGCREASCAACLQTRFPSTTSHRGGSSSGCTPTPKQGESRWILLSFALRKKPMKNRFAGRRSSPRLHPCPEAPPQLQFV
jgi:hypothetical protein